MGKVVLVTGGARSGKSAFAERLAGRNGRRVAYVATAEACDAEMDARIARHRERRPATWTTIEAPRDLPALTATLDPDLDAVLIDCLGVWASNRLLGLGEDSEAGWWADVAALEAALKREVEGLVATASAASWDLVVVSNEVGFGVVPPTPLGRAFRDLLGRLNQAVAARADAVFLVVAGIGVELKRIALAPTEGDA